MTRLPPKILETIVAGTYDETGVAFFDRLVKQLATALGTRHAWVTEWLEAPRRLRALSFWSAEGKYRDFEYHIEGTPCQPVVLEQELVHIPDRVVELYPSDSDLKPLDAVSYMGVPLLDTGGEVLGHLAVLHDDVLPESAESVAVLKIFASRAAAELRRLQRERAIQQRERRLHALVGSAMDGILELDADCRIVRMNPAALRLLQCDGGRAIEKPVSHFLSASAFGKLQILLASLRAGDPGRESLWIPDGLETIDGEGAAFRAEAAIACYEVENERCYTLFLRNMDDRIAAANRIEALLAETASLRAEIDALQGFGEIVGRSKALRNVLRDVDAVAASDAAVLITGETGTGKELIAAAIHRRSPRAGGPLVKVNCAAIPASLQESEFFGHERGAFTGATQRRDGRFKQAHRGTIFLDEVGELPLDLQAKLLRVLQDGEFQSVGGAYTIRVDVRVIAATNRDLERMAREGTFRQDLLYRLNVFPIAVPPLRERGTDITLLAHDFARNAAKRRGWRDVQIAPEDEARLLAYDWPGNVRELANVIERALITSTDARTLNLARALPDSRSVAVLDSTESPARILTATEWRELERQNILRALEASGGKIAGAGGAAERLGMNPNTLSSRMKSLRIQRGPASGPK